MIIRENGKGSLVVCLDSFASFARQGKKLHFLSPLHNDNEIDNGNDIDNDINNTDDSNNV